MARHSARWKTGESAGPRRIGKIAVREIVTIPPPYDLPPGFDAAMDEMASMHPTYYNTKQLADKLGLDFGTVRRRLTKQSFPGAFKDEHGHWLIPSCYADPRLWFVQAHWAWDAPQDRPRKHGRTAKAREAFERAATLWAAGYTDAAIGETIGRHPMTIRAMRKNWPQEWQEVAKGSITKASIPVADRRKRGSSRDYEADLLAKADAVPYMPLAKAAEAVVQLRVMRERRLEYVSSFAEYALEAAKHLRRGSESDRRLIFELAEAIGVLEPVQAALEMPEPEEPPAMEPEEPPAMEPECDEKALDEEYLAALPLANNPPLRLPILAPEDARRIQKRLADGEAVFFVAQSEGVPMGSVENIDHGWYPGLAGGENRA